MNDLIWKEIQEKNGQFKADNDSFWEAEQVYRKWAAEDRKRRCAPTALPLFSFTAHASQSKATAMSGVPVMHDCVHPEAAGYGIDSFDPADMELAA